MRHLGPSAQVVEEVAEQFLLQPAGQPLGSLLGIACLEADEEPARSLADPFAGAGDKGLAAPGNAAGNGGFLGELADGLRGGVRRGLARQVSRHVPPAHDEQDTDRRPGHGGHVIQGTEEPDDGRTLDRKSVV